MVDSGPVTAPAGVQSHFDVACPTGKVVVGGGAFTVSADLMLDLNSSYPNGTTKWHADENNASGAAMTMHIYAICIKKPKAYKVITGASLTNPAASQTHATAACAGKSKLLGGGGYSSSPFTQVNLNSSYPTGKTWAIDMNNASTGAASTQAYAICGQQVKGLVALTGDTEINSPGTEDLADVTCTGSKVALSGGVFSDTTSTSENINSLVPETSALWRSYMNNTDPVLHHITSHVICAGT